MLRARCIRFSGFHIFAKEQKGNKKIVRFANGKDYMKSLSKSWARLSAPQRKKYHFAAFKKSQLLKKNSHQRMNAAHRATTYSLLMRLLYSKDKFGSNFFDAEFAGKMCAGVAQRLSETDAAALRRHFDVSNVARSTSWKKKDYESTVGESGEAFCSAYAYNSFTEMQRAVVGTDPLQIFLNVSLLNSNMRMTSQYRSLLNKRWETVQRSPIKQALYQPISDKEASKFEHHCASVAYAPHPDSVPIAQMFCEFRGLQWTGPKVRAGPLSMKNKVVFQRLLHQDRRHKVFERVLAAQESIDSAPSLCAQSDSAPAVVPPEFYRVIPDTEITKLAVEIARTRRGMSVFDATTQRINKWRLEHNN